MQIIFGTKIASNIENKHKHKINMKGNIGVTTENIFPVIKKFLYSDHEIFLRELVSNAVDATQKLKTLAESGEAKCEMSDLTIRIFLDEKKKTLTISDHGIGMTEEEIDKYINQIAFSGATDFLEKYKDTANAIIGHFGLGFYSAFMVSKQVEIKTLSYKEGAKAVHWTCDGTPDFEIKDCKKKDRGTDIILHIDDDCKEYLEKNQIQQLLRKYCHFMPVSIAFGKKTEWKDGKEQETEEDNIINNTAPIWRSKPTELKDEDYKKFYRDLYPMQDEPLFYIHLNVDYPFNLTGVLYFPKIKSNIDLQRNKIQLYCNQVFVTDSVENIVPDFLTLLHGVIDSPDIPLNVSRSYLQSDANVKKISKYITKKVSDRLENIFKEDRKQYEEKWDDLKLFINYGMLSEPEFYDKAKNFTLFKDTEGKYFTFDEYKTLIKDNQTDKDGNLIYLYANDVDSQYSFIQTAKDKGYSVLLMDGQLDTPAVGLFEEKFEKSRFTRVDGDIIDRLIQKEDLAKTTLTEDDSQSLSQCFKSQFPTMPSTEFSVSVESMGATTDPVVITQSEYMRRMKEMSKIQSGMAFYGQMPDMYSVALNCDHPLIQEILKDIKVSTDDKLSSHRAEIKGLNARKSVLQEEKKKNDKDEATQKSLDECEKSITDERNDIEDILKTYGKDCKKIHQLIDLALLHNGLLKGQSLNEFIKRSIEML